MRIVSLLAVVGLLGACAALDAQTPGAVFLAFDSASVKPSTSGGARGGRLGGGMLEQTNVTLKELVALAFGGGRRREISGGPNWLDVEHFDIVARGDFGPAAFLPGSDGSTAPVYLMLRSLLIDRFRIAAHLVTEQRPVYALQWAREDRKPGPGLHATEVNCDAVLAAQAKGEPPDVPASARRPPCSMRRAPGRINGNSVTLAVLADVLSGSADRPVVDQTGLSGFFDVDLEWGELQAGSSDRPLPRDAHAGDDEPIFTAIRNQLGLKLQATRAGVEVVVIDHAEHPTQN
jgi:uncharacterized protein (TIGR03435 family)